MYGGHFDLPKKVRFLCAIILRALKIESLNLHPFNPNAVPPAHTLMAFLSSVIPGAKRFAHTDWLRSDRVLHVMLGIERFPGTNAVRNHFARFTLGAVDAFW